MAERIRLPHGVLQKNDHELIVEIPLKNTKVIEAEQLMELTKSDSLFLACQKQEIKESTIYLCYTLPNGYKPLQQYTGAALKTKIKIAKEIMQIQKIQGTQFTTYIHPDNIYANSSGDVKFVHRGIRSVLPPELEDGKAFVFHIKCLIISLFTGKSFAELVNKGLTNIMVKHSFVKDLGKAKSLSEIENILSSNVQVQETEQKIIKDSKPVEKLRKTNDKINDQNLSEIKPHKEQDKQQITKENKKWATPFSFLLIGLLIGIVIMYMGQVKPNSNALASSNDDKKSVEKKLVMVNAEKDRQEQLLAAYRLLADGKNDEAIKKLASIKNLSDEDQQLLVREYMKQNTPESLRKAAMLSNEFNDEIAAKLVALNTEDSKKVLLNLQSDSPSIQIEQAWLKKEYDTVTQIAAQQPKSNKRAKRLAINSYLELGKTKEAEGLAKEIGDIPLQIKAKEQEIKSIKDDKKKSKKQKEKEIKEINKSIEKLKKKK